MRIHSRHIKICITSLLALFVSAGSVSASPAPQATAAAPEASEPSDSHAAHASAPASADGSKFGFGVSGLIGVPVGDLSDGVTVIPGALVSVEYAVASRVEITGRAGYMRFVFEDDIGLSFSNVPVWAGARYRLSPDGQGFYVRGEAGLNRLGGGLAGVGSGSGNELGGGIGIGTELGNFTADATLNTLILDDASDWMMLSLSAGGTW